MKNEEWRNKDEEPMKQIKLSRRALLFGMLILLLTGAGAAFGSQYYRSAQGKDQAGSVRIITATDLHYLSPRINDKGETLQKLSSKGDGKVLPYSGEIVEAFLDQVVGAKPDLLVLTGDLTFNGEAASHEDLVELLKKVESQGIEVLVIPGNHDIQIPFAYEFREGFAWETNSVTYAEFYELYKDFGRAEARLQDPASFSYIKEVSEKLWIAMIDVNTELNSNRVSRETLTWLDETLAEARSKGITVITGTHQNVLVHNERFNEGYLIDNSSDLKEILDAYGVRYNMSGHIHIQHLALQESGLNESVTGALSVSPHNFAKVTIDRELQLDYQTEPVEVSDWARQKNLQDPNLLDFSNYSNRYFYDISFRRNLLRYEDDAELTEEELTKLAALSAELNVSYFAGDVISRLETLKNDPDYVLWHEKAGDNPFRAYIDSFLKQSPKNENAVQFSLKPASQNK